MSDLMILEAKLVMQRIGVFGSAFDPPTCGHLDVLRQASPEFDEILLVPSAAHAFDKKSQPFAVRARLLEAFVRDAKDLPCKLNISLIESRLLQENPDKPVYTYDLLTALSRLRPNDQISFIRGPDNAEDKTWQRFYRYQDIEKNWSIFTARQLSPARSSLARQLVADGAGADQLATMLSPLVLELVLDLNLYRNVP